MIQRRQTRIDPRLEEITPDQVRRYMDSLGFQRRSYPRLQDVEAFVGPRDIHGRELLVLLCNEPRSRFYLVYLTEIMDTLTLWEDRPESEIVTDILKLPKKAG